MINNRSFIYISILYSIILTRVNTLFTYDTPTKKLCQNFTRTLIMLLFDTVLPKQQITMTCVNNVHGFPVVSLFRGINVCLARFYSPRTTHPEYLITSFKQVHEDSYMVTPENFFTYIYHWHEWCIDICTPVFLD
jgi:hypothetical protein